MVSDPGTCDDGSSSGFGGTGDDVDDHTDGDQGDEDGSSWGTVEGVNSDVEPLEMGNLEGESGFGLGCSTPIAPTGMLAFLGLLASARRREDGLND